MCQIFEEDYTGYFLNHAQLVEGHFLLGSVNN